MSEGETAYEYRVMTRTEGNRDDDGDEVFASHAAALEIANDIEGAGEYAEVWIERRPLAAWERV